MVDFMIHFGAHHFMAMVLAGVMVMATVGIAGIDGMDTLFMVTDFTIDIIIMLLILEEAMPTIDTMMVDIIITLRLETEVT